MENRENNDISLLEKRKFDENFDIMEFLEKHDPKKTSIKKNHTPKVILIILITVCIILAVIVVLIGLSFTGRAPKNILLGKWEQANGAVLEITEDKFITSDGTVDYKLSEDSSIELDINGSKMSAAYQVEDNMLFIMIPYEDETATLEYMRAKN